MQTLAGESKAAPIDAARADALPTYLSAMRRGRVAILSNSDIAIRYSSRLVTIQHYTFVFRIGSFLQLCAPRT